MATYVALHLLSLVQLRTYTYLATAGGAVEHCWWRAGAGRHPAGGAASQRLLHPRLPPCQGGRGGGQQQWQGPRLHVVLKSTICSYVQRNHFV